MKNTGFKKELEQLLKNEGFMEEEAAPTKEEPVPTKASTDPSIKRIVVQDFSVITELGPFNVNAIHKTLKSRTKNVYSKVDQGRNVQFFL